MSSASLRTIRNRYAHGQATEASKPGSRATRTSTVWTQSSASCWLRVRVTANRTNRWDVRSKNAPNASTPEALSRSVQSRTTLVKVVLAGHLPIRMRDRATVLSKIFSHIAIFGKFTAKSRPTARHSFGRLVFGRQPLHAGPPFSRLTGGDW